MVQSIGEQCAPMCDSAGGMCKMVIVMSDKNEVAIRFDISFNPLSYCCRWGNCANTTDVASFLQHTTPKFKCTFFNACCERHSLDNRLSSPLRNEYIHLL